MFIKQRANLVGYITGKVQGILSIKGVHIHIIVVKSESKTKVRSEEYYIRPNAPLLVA